MSGFNEQATGHITPDALISSCGVGESGPLSLAETQETEPAPPACTSAGTPAATPSAAGMRAAASLEVGAERASASERASLEEGGGFDWRGQSRRASTNNVPPRQARRSSTRVPAMTARMSRSRSAAVGDLVFAPSADRTRGSLEEERPWVEASRGKQQRRSSVESTPEHDKKGTGMWSNLIGGRRTSADVSDQRRLSNQTSTSRDGERVYAEVLAVAEAAPPAGPAVKRAFAPVEDNMSSPTELHGAKGKRFHKVAKATMFVNRFRRVGSSKGGVEKSLGSTFLGRIFGTTIEEEDEDEDFNEVFRTPSYFTRELTTRNHSLRSLMSEHPSENYHSESSKIRSTMFDLEEEEDQAIWRQNIEMAIDSVAFGLLMLAVTVWALFGDDLRLIFTYKPDDEVFVVLNIVCLVFFFLELALASASKRGYFLGFYFCLDAVATASLFLDIPAVFEAIVGVSEMDSTVDSSESSDEGNAGLGGNAELARAGRASSVGTRAGRIVRLVRLVRILKLYKQAMSRRKGHEEDEDEEEEYEDGRSRSRVGKKLSEFTTRRTIVGVLLMLFGLQLFEADTYESWDVTPYAPAASFMEGGLDLVVATYQSGTWEQFDATARSYVDNTRGMYWLKVNGVEYSNYTRYGKQGGALHRELRGGEFLEYTVTRENMRVSFVKFDTRHLSVLQAALNMARTVFICIILGMGALMFSHDANVLVILPLEAIFMKVRIVASNPLKAPEIIRQEEENKTSGTTNLESIKEMVMLDNMFLKLCALLGVGYGVAGAEIIAENMASGVGLNPMVPGKKMVAIFGFCDIRQFTDATEVLQEGVMEFVNSIAQIVHMEVHLLGGSANKNIGDAFLLVWKFPEEITMHDIIKCLVAGEPQGDNCRLVSGVADKALASFIVMQAMIKKSAKLREYSKMKELCERMPNYSVKMGFGLHVGWAIEGAIGSQYKVDASYLSPNVNMASRLEAATKQFGTKILLSGDFLSCLSKPVQKKCRAIDRVTVKGSKKPMLFATYDVEEENLEFDPEDPIYKRPPIEFTSSKVAYENLFEEHPDIVGISTSTPDFLTKFSTGFHYYIRGEWSKAERILKQCERTRKTRAGHEIEDGPTQTLLRVMSENNFKAPTDWEGFRELTEK